MARKIEGIVTSDKMNKTITVAVSHQKKHEKYHKYFTVTNKFKAHDENEEAKIGDHVIIEETRPLSKEKRWKLLEIVTKAKQEEVTEVEV
ncbi:MAG: 30S ribosomal protein S17 [Candidatus Harrisonbacteria bacterium CG10_big_fil_rev_8_21_14_0_10_38_8]|uniref:Small ribosomal subunit protein uS17 n=1 Tax=Candidatus Harrisonbacteria bacterium CG10_big_fil_rev_8_21_14_0_10_38_8 TaxID=1974582 RepID=A0A2M6WK61_9BACT|nr:MAG: 30S ribosomal protein S17 [Candidatus Harrisonbacteria bacterium CG10_big_fil_rev_8_21_14_0_10_38_8]